MTQTIPYELLALILVVLTGAVILWQLPQTVFQLPDIQKTTEKRSKDED